MSFTTARQQNIDTIGKLVKISGVSPPGQLAQLSELARRIAEYVLPLTTVWVRHVSETRSTWKRAKTSGAALPFGRGYSIGHIKLNQRTSDLHGLLEKLSILAKGPVMKDAINAMRGSAKYDWDSLTYGYVRQTRLPSTGPCCGIRRKCCPHRHGYGFAIN